MLNTLDACKKETNKENKKPDKLSFGMLWSCVFGFLCSIPDWIARVHMSDSKVEISTTVYIYKYTETELDALSYIYIY